MQSTKWLSLALAGLAATACDTMSPSDPGALVPATVAEDATIPAIDMNGSRFHLETFGNSANPVIVFLHGGPGGDYRSMLRLAARYDGYSLADDHYLVFWDQRGTGLSRRHGRDAVSLDLYLADLDSLVNRYSPGRPVYLIGLSWGGMYATRYIDEHPGRVAGAVLIEPGPLDGATAERLDDDMFDLAIGAEWLEDWAWSTQFLSPDDHARMDYQRMLGAKDAQPKFGLSTTDPEPAWRMGAAANRFISEDGQDGNGRWDYDFTRHLPAYTTPVLFVAGSLSQVLGPSLQQQQILKYPSASLAVISGAGHDVAWVKSAAVLDQIRPYLAARRGGTQ